MKSLFDGVDLKIYGKLEVTLKTGSTVEFLNVDYVECDEEFIYISSDSECGYLKKSEVVFLRLVDKVPF